MLHPSPALAAALLAAAAVSGCLGGATDVASTHRPAATDGIAGDAGGAQGRMAIAGTVFSPDLHPLGNATVRLLSLGMAQVTTPSGAFRFDGLEPGLHTVLVTAPGHHEAAVTVAPDGDPLDVAVVLERLPSNVPYSIAYHHAGHIPCALEALIITPSCDSAVTAEVPGAPPVDRPRAFPEDQSFLFETDRQWATLVFDVVFEAHPGLDGLRFVLRGAKDPEAGGGYEQYGRWRGASSYTVRVEPGQTYPEGTQPTDANATGFEVDVYPGGHFAKPAGTGFLGVGFAPNVRFDVYAMAFYVEPAPDGWSIRGSP